MRWDFEEIFQRIMVFALLSLPITLPLLYFLAPHSPPRYSLSEAKNLLETKVVHDHRLTLYCEAEFDDQKDILNFDALETSLPAALRMTWEHAVPVSAFGRNFTAWTEGHRDCVRNGQKYKGRKCAERISGEFDMMQTDMYNLFPAISLVNAIRSNRSYAELPKAPIAFETCAVKTARGKFEPPDHAKGTVARAALYMAAAYEKYSLSPEEESLFLRWDEQFPPDQWECARTKRIEKLQKKENLIVKKQCQQTGLW